MKQFYVLPLGIEVGDVTVKKNESFIGVGHFDNGTIANGFNSKSKNFIIIGRKPEHGGDIYIPIDYRNLAKKTVKSTYEAPVRFEANVTIQASTNTGDHALAIVRKGVEPGKRRQWTISYYNNSLTTTPEELANAFADLINKMDSSLGLVASARRDVINVAGTDFGDYEIMPIENLNAQVSIVTQGFEGRNTNRQINEMFKKYAASLGYEYPETDGQLYPLFNTMGLPVDPVVDSQYTVYTFTYKEENTSDLKTQPLLQTIQIATTTDLDTLFKLS